MTIAKTFNSTQCEDKWYSHWIEKGYFNSTPDDREAFTIVIPPPNVTGVLHMGHMLNNTLQDVLIRRARMQGFNTCWVPGTDHASIATEAKVVDKLAKQGIQKSDLSRQEFLKHAWEWKETHGGIILEQLKKLGASCDWKRTKFTMDEALSESVIKVFVDLYQKGLVYRGVRMVNWDSKALTALSDEEVIHKEVNSKLYFINYSIDGSNESLTIATTRPETILGDTAICVNPNDKRYSHLKGKQALQTMFVDGITKFIISNKKQKQKNYYIVHFERNKITYMTQINHQKLHYVYFVQYDELRQNNVVETEKEKFWNLVNAAINDQQQQLADIFEVRGEEPNG